MNEAYGWACDFETNNDENDCHVWAWGMENIETGEYFKGTTLGGFLSKVALQKEGNFYFHNLKFDGGFLLDWLTSHGYKHTNEFKIHPFEFSSLISGNGMFYNIKFKAGKRVRTFIDSLKIIPSTIEAMPKMFGLETFKGEIDYNKLRPVGYKPTDDEWDYLKRDVHILACSLKYLFERGNRKMTAASNAFTYLKDMKGKDWKRLFPTLEFELDYQIRAAYRGGYCIVGPAAVGDVGAGIVLDKNSMYPDKMRNCLLPYGEPVSFKGRYEHDNRFPLYVQRLRCAFHVKHSFLPTIQLKHNIGYMATEYLKESRDSDGNLEIIDLTLTSIDLEIFLEHYDVYGLEYLGGWKFMASKELLKDYVDYWYKVKEEATLSGNVGMRTLAKLMLNSCYGKFGKRGIGTSKIPYMGEDEVVHYKQSEEEEQGLEYIPIACFITAYARQDIIRMGQQYYDRLLYIDTDSLHLLGEEIPADLDIDKSRLGAWDVETKFDRARYIRAKTYIEDVGGKLIVKCAGMPKQCKESVTWENFQPGNEFEGKLQHKTVKGGVILKEIPFKIKVDK